MKETAGKIAEYLEIICSLSIRTGKIPNDWLIANLIRIFFKKGDKTDPANNRPVSLTSVRYKIMEHIISSTVNNLDNNTFM